MTTEGETDTLTGEPLAEDHAAQTEGIRKSERLKSGTEKGRAYRIGILIAQMKSINKRLNKQVEFVDSLLEVCNIDAINKEMISMEKTYTEYTEAYARSCGLTSDLTDDEIKSAEELDPNQLAALMEEMDTKYMDCKVRVCNLLLQEEKKHPLVDKASSKSSRSSASGSRSSRSSGRSRRSDRSIRQQAKVAGLKAEAEAMKKTKEAELAAELSRLEQKIKKAEAKEKVYSSFEENLKEEEDLKFQKGIETCTKTHTKNKTHIETNKVQHSNNIETHTETDKHPTTVSELSTTEQLQTAIIDMMKIQSAPKPELDVFSGDPLEYMYFKASFKEVVEATVNDQRGRLTRLIKYTTGEAKELIQHLVHADHRDCYDVAISLLDKEYGSPHLLTVSYLKKLRNWGSLKENDTTEFKKLYRFLIKCQTYKKDKLLLELDSTEMIRLIISKLPQGQQRRWSRKAVETRRSLREAGFDDLVRFIENEVEILSDPAYSRAALAELPQMKSNITRFENSPSVQLDVVDENCYQCTLCGNMHDIEECKVYIGKDIDQRHKTIFHHNLCFSCLKPRYPFRKKLHRGEEM
jgi:hypothetical protein